jgi:hypothetical protein
MASASRNSFFCPLRYGCTYFAETTPAFRIRPHKAA